MSMERAHLIFYVAEQARSSAFYRSVLGAAPRLDVPGMTEFVLPGGSVLGLMPEAGISRLLGDALVDPASAGGVPRAELYLVVDDPRAYHKRAVDLGARELSPLLPRDWGSEVAYSADPDGHVLAFARMASGELARRRFLRVWLIVELFALLATGMLYFSLLKDLEIGVRAGELGFFLLILVVVSVVVVVPVTFLVSWVFARRGRREPG